ncbi:hypothetical protein [Providencia sp.]|uniref:hypothetical protein n=1 Tax=Providencia sp. TaxID=589 RepID=UPI003F9E204C
MKVPVQQTPLKEIDIEIAREVYKAYERKYGSSQSFEQIIKRSGFCWAEIAYHLYEQVQHLEQAIREIEAERAKKSPL